MDLIEIECKAKAFTVATFVLRQAAAAVADRHKMVAQANEAYVAATNAHANAYYELKTAAAGV